MMGAETLKQLAVEKLTWSVNQKDFPRVVNEVPVGMVLEVAKRLRMCCCEDKLSEQIPGMRPVKRFFITLF
jgi:hypothetical protein